LAYPRTAPFRPNSHGDDNRAMTVLHAVSTCGRLPMPRTFLATLGIIAWLAVLAPSASAQAVAFQPGVASFPNGVSMSTTPVVSVDRRYVRLGVSPFFTGLQGFDTFPVPAAVGGGGFAGPVGGMGFAGPIGGVGFAGMDGPMDGMAAFERRLAGFASPNPIDAFGEPTPPRWRQQRTAGPQARSIKKQKSHRRGSQSRGG